jgi:putative membrane protein
MFMKKNQPRIRISHLIIASALAAAPLSGQADDSDSSKSKASTSASEHFGTDKQSIIKNSAKMNLATQKFADLAQEKAQSQELKQFAQTLKQDHQKAQQELERLAQKHSVTLPTSVDDKCQQEISRLEALSGEEFDREFAKGAIEGHAMAVAHLQKASSAAEDTDLRQYTQQMLSKIKQHQSKGREIAKAVGVDQTTISSLETKAQNAVGGPAASASGASSDSSSSNSSTERGDSSDTSKKSSTSDTEKKSDE